MSLEQDNWLCLKQLLNILSINENKLAKAINVDPSLVSRWVNGKRPISTKSDYIKVISDYLSKNVYDKVQISKIQSMCQHLEVETNRDYNDVKENIHNLLEASQRRIIANIKSERYKESNNAKLDVSQYPYCVNDIQKYSDEYAHEYSNNNICYGAQKFEIYYENISILNKLYNMFKGAEYTKPVSQNTIMITFLSNIDFTHDYDIFNSRLLKILPGIIANGWNISLILLFNNNKYKTKKIIQLIKEILPTSSVNIYYIKKYGMINNPVDTIIVPGIGAMTCFYNAENTRIENAFFFNDKAVMNILEKQFLNLYSQSIPLLNIYSGNNRTTFLQSLIDAEDNSGNCFVYNKGLSYLTMPKKLFEKYISLTRLPDNYRNSIMKYHTERLNMFYSNINSYKFYCIYSAKVIDCLIKSNTYKAEDIGFHYDINATDKDLIEHLEYIIQLIENHENFNVALVNKYSNIDSRITSFFLKQNTGIFMNVYNKTAKNFEKLVGMSILESTSAIAFEDSFMNTWEEISPIYKERPYVVRWFKTKIEELKKRL